MCMIYIHIYVHVYVYVFVYVYVYTYVFIQYGLAWVVPLLLECKEDWVVSR